MSFSGKDRLLILIKIVKRDKIIAGTICIKKSSSSQSVDLCSAKRTVIAPRNEARIAIHTCVVFHARKKKLKLMIKAIKKP